MRRRDFLTSAGATAATIALPRVAKSQQKVARVAYFTRSPPELTVLDALRQGLAERGFVEGKNLVLDIFASATDADLVTVIDGAIGTRPDVLVAVSTAPALVAKAATKTIPIVALNISDPVGTGLVTSLAHPESNVTGNSIISPDLTGRQVATLKELVPGLHRFAVPYFPSDPISGVLIPQVQAASRATNIEPLLVDFDDQHDYEAQFDRVFSANVQGALQLSYGQLRPFFDLQYDLYLKNKLPVVSGQALRPGTATPFYGVVHYASDIIGMDRTRAAAMVDAILRGAKPADIPIEQPTLFDAAINLDLARKIGVTIPTSILAQATLVIDYDLRALH